MMVESKSICHQTHFEMVSIEAILYLNFPH